MQPSLSAFLVGVFSTLCLFDIGLMAQAPRDRVTRRIDERARVTRAGNRHPLARPENDAGLAAPETTMGRMMLLLQPDEAQQQALEELLAAQHDPESPQYHQWLTPESFGQ